MGWLQRFSGRARGVSSVIRVGASQRRAGSASAFMRAFYESAEPGGDDAKHWTKAGSFSARQINSPEVRETLRNRCRFEVANNSMARGIVDTLADTLIGDGPRAQIADDESLSREDAQAVERAWNDWCDDINLWEKLRTGRKAKAHDGEIFFVRTTNQALGGITLDIVPVEAERVAHPRQVDRDPREVDGIRFDAAGNPSEYRVLRYHPDDNLLGIDVDEHDWVDAGDVIHYFTRDRAGSVRGIPDLTPALSGFVNLRRFTQAVIKSARTAASMSKVIQSDLPVDADGEIDSADPYDEIEIPENHALVLPEGWKLNGMKAEQPTTTFGEFRRHVANEIGRCLGMPVNLVLADSSQHNYASGKLDHATWFQKLRVDRQEVRTKILNRIFLWWLEEAQRTDVLPQAARRARPPIRPTWTWPTPQHADPSKEANAMKVRLETGVTTLVEECAALGHDWQDVLENRERVQRFASRLGITVAPNTPEARPPASPEGSGQGVNTREDDDE